MDAKPQRPIRSIRGRGDENAHPEQNKTLHQRFKSASDLPAVKPTAGLKLNAKRTAFGDISNTGRVLQPAKDDSSLPSKPVVHVPETSVPKLPAKKSAPLLRPAQRPLSVAGLKSFVGHAFHGTSNLPALQEPQYEEIPLTENALVVKRTVVQKETVVLPNLNNGTSDTIDEQEQSNTSAQSREIGPVVPVHRNLAPRQHKSQPYLRAEQPVLRRTRSKYSGVVPAEPLVQLVTKASFSDEVINEKSEQAYDGDHDDQSSAESEASGEILPATEVYQASTGYAPTQQEHNQQVMHEIIQQRDRLLEVEVVNAKTTLETVLPLVSEPIEPEEYWEDEEDDEGYDDEGYTTARSFRSRGDNTTGGATAVLFPKMTSRVRKELAAAKQIVEATQAFDDIDDEIWDTSMVAEYGDEIFQYMRELEIKMLPNAHYMDNQHEIQWSMRSVLMDWLIQVHHRFNLLPETLYLCVNYIDRFLSCKIVSLGKLQLVGATAIFVAAKYEEINCPSVQEIVYMVDGGYTADEILKAERFMLSMLSFELGFPGPMSFLRRISKADDYDLETRTLAKYFLEITVMDERFVGSPPSYLAAGAHCLARFMLKKGHWTPAHVYHSNYTLSQLRQLLQMMVECCENPRQHHGAVYEKYADRHYKRASLFVEGEIQRGFQMPE